MYPFVFIAAALAVFFAVSALQGSRMARLLAAVLWGAYGVYEYHVANGTLCDPNCNIRVDLVLFLPLLGSAAYLALKRQPSPGAVALLAVICLGLAAWLSSLFGHGWVSLLSAVAALAVATLGIKAKLAGRRA